jgi:LysM repeat protein
MVIKPILWIFLFCLSGSVFAQPVFQVQGVTPGLYLSHKVQARETWYAIGRMYNLSPKDIAAYNGTDISKGLTIGEALKIPLNTTNFSQDGNKAADEVLVPVYHKVAEGEWMYRISTNHNKVAVEQLEKWNKISSNQVKAGLNLIVGYMKLKKDPNAVASAGPKAPIEPPKETKPIVSTVDPKQPVSTPAPAPVLKKVEPETTTPVATLPSPNFNGGYFKSQYAASGKTAKGTATIFRSTSGWNDGKYYALMDNVAVGTIIMVSNNTTNKYVYAKVLGSLSDIRENAALTLRISNAAAAELGAGEGKFTAEVKY